MTPEPIALRHPLAPGVVVEAGELWTFPQGLIGFPALRRFARVPLAGAEPFELLASVEEPSFGIVVVDPHAVIANYDLSLSETSLAPIRTRDPEQLEVRVSVVLPADGTPFSLNLKGPIVLSPQERVGVQCVSTSDDHAVRFLPTDAATCSF